MVRDHVDRRRVMEYDLADTAARFSLSELSRPKAII